MEFAVTTIIEIDPEDWAEEYGVASDAATVEADIRSWFAQDVAGSLNDTHAFGPNAKVLSVTLGPALDEYEMVTEWSHVTFDRPVWLVPRGQVRIGDLVHSSHGYKGVVTDVATRGTVGPGTTTITIELHRAGSGIKRSESYPADSTIPVLRFATEATSVQA